MEQFGGRWNSLWEERESGERGLMDKCLCRKKVAA